MRYKLPLLLLYVLFVTLAFTQEALKHELYRNQIALAEAYRQMNETSEAVKTLSATSPELRGWEYRFLSTMVDPNAQTVQAHKGGVSKLVFSPDGKKLFSVGADSSVRIWNYPEMTVDGQLPGHTAPISTVDISADGRLLATGGRDKTAIIWDTRTRRPVYTLTEGFSQAVYSVKFSPDARLLSVTSWKRDPVKNVIGFAEIFDVASGKLLQYIELDDHPTSCSDFSATGKLLVIGSWGEAVYCYNTSDWSQRWVHNLRQYGTYAAVDGVKILPGDRGVAVVGKAYRTFYLDMADGALRSKVEPWEGHEKNIRDVGIDPTGKWVATCGEDNRIIVRETEGNRKVLNLTGHVKAVNGLAFHPSLPVLVSASADGTLKIWQLDEPAERVFGVCIYGPWYLPFSPASRLAAAACSDSIIGIWNLQAGVREGAINGLAANAAAFNNNGKILFSAGHKKIVHATDWRTGKDIWTYDGHTASVFGMSYFEPNDWLLSIGNDETVRVLSGTNGRLLYNIRVPGSGNGVQITPDGKKMVVPAGDGAVKIYNTGSWQLQDSIPCDRELFSFAISPNGRTAIATGYKVTYVDLETGKPIRALDGHQGAVWGVDIHPSGRFALTCSYDHTVKYWDLETGNCLLTIRGFEQELFKIAWLNETDFAVTEVEGMVHVYRVR